MQPNTKFIPLIKGQPPQTLPCLFTKRFRMGAKDKASLLSSERRLGRLYMFSPWNDCSILRMKYGHLKCCSMKIAKDSYCQSLPCLLVWLMITFHVFIYTCIHCIYHLLFFSNMCYIGKFISIDVSHSFPPLFSFLHCALPTESNNVSRTVVI